MAKTITTTVLMGAMYLANAQVETDVLTNHNQPQKTHSHLGVVMSFTMNKPDYLMFIAVSSTIWRVRYHADVHIIAVNYRGSPMPVLPPPFVSFMDSIGVNISITMLPSFVELRESSPLLRNLTDMTLVKAAGQVARAHHTNWTRFRPEQVVVVSDADLYPTHSHLFFREFVCAWTMLWNGEFKRLESRTVNGLIQCNEGDKKEHECVHGAYMLTFCFQFATSARWAELFPPLPWAEVLHAQARAFGRMHHFSDQIYLTSRLWETNMTVCAVWRGSTAGTLYPHTITRGTLWQLPGSLHDIITNHMAYHHGPGRRYALGDEEWALQVVVLDVLIPRRAIGHLDILRLSLQRFVTEHVEQLTSTSKP